MFIRFPPGMKALSTKQSEVTKGGNAIQDPIKSIITDWFEDYELIDSFN